MSKKTFITITVGLTILLIGLLGYYFLTKNDTPGTGGIISGFKDFFPFGGSENPSPTTTTEQTNNENNNEPTPQQNFVQKLRKISAQPVSGAGSVDVKAGTVVRYIEKATGHIYEVELFSPKLARISNTTIPLSYDAVWGNSNNSIIARYLREDDQNVDTYSLNINNKSTTTENITSGLIFPENISDVSVFGSNVFYLVQNTNSSSGFISGFDGKNKKQVWGSDIKELNSQFVNSRTVALNTKPHFDIPGFLYLVDTITGGVKKILGNVAGLSTNTNSDLSKVIYIEQGGNTEMFIYEVKNKTHTKITPNTMPEKCVWSKKNKDIVYCGVPEEFINSNSQDSWYKGLISFNDDVWMFDTKNNTSSVLQDLENESGEKIDLTKPILSENEQYLIFVNKIDNSLWSLDLIKPSTTSSN